MNNHDDTPRKNEESHGFLYRFFEWIISKITKPKPSTLEESVTELIKEHDLQDTMHSEEREMLENFIDFRDLKAYEVMIPRTFIIGINYTASFEELRERFVKEGHTRVPVYKDNLDDIIGFVHMKDFVPYIGRETEFKLEKLVRELIYAPRSMKIIDLLARMRRSGIHIAIILDEYGGTDGLITIEDLVEEIIGDIRDEHDHSDQVELVKVEGETITIDGKAKIEDVEDKFNVSLKNDNDDFETFGGLILSYLGRIPTIGEIIEHPSGLEFEIFDSDERKIKAVKVKLRNR